MVFRTLFLLFLFNCNIHPLYANDETESIIVFEGLYRELISENAYILLDTNNEMSFNDILHTANFSSDSKPVPNLGLSNGTVWAKFTIKNISDFEYFSLEVENALLEHLTLYAPQGNNYVTYSISKDVPFYTRSNRSPNPFFDLHILKNETKTFYLKVNSPTQLLLPLKFGTVEAINDYDFNRNILRGIYFGVIIGMILYNPFIFYSTRDKSYIFFAFYTICVGLVQLNITGLGFKYLWFNYPNFEKYSLFIFPALTATTSIAFARSFLNIKEFVPRINKIFTIINLLYLLTILNAFFGNKTISYSLINIIALPLACLLIWVGFYLWFKLRYRPALVFLIAWTLFLLSVIAFVLKDFSLLPYNLFTISILQIGSAVVVILLSIALADKINLYKAEKETSQQEKLQVLQENERIIREQNIILEQSVQERTKELQQTNDNLEKTLVELKEAEMQLVESEKMASLGQLTAGIAHEINNPINFVTSNVKPLKRDITLLQEIITQVEDISVLEISADEKRKRINEIKEQADFDYTVTEIDYLLKGISEGASRTSEIVKGLRVFSRLDEDDIKLADINEGLDSTIVIVNNLLNGKIAVEKNYQELPLVECYPGKLNQVFLNMMSNGIHAIHERWKEEMGGKLTISTYGNEHDVTISIKDNGIGMSEETKKKLFEPFFTTKDVGVGTGLGLSIAWNTIKKHNGLIQVNSEIGVGTEFVMTIPIKYSEPQND